MSDFRLPPPQYPLGSRQRNTARPVQAGTNEQILSPPVLQNPLHSKGKPRHEDLSKEANHTKSDVFFSGSSNRKELPKVRDIGQYIKRKKELKRFRPKDQKDVGPCLIPGFEKADSTVETDIEVWTAMQSGKSKKDWSEKARLGYSHLKDRHNHASREKPEKEIPSLPVVDRAAIEADIRAKKVLNQRNRNGKDVGPSLVPGYEQVDSSLETDVEVTAAQASKTPRDQWPDAARRGLWNLKARRNKPEPEKSVTAPVIQGRESITTNINARKVLNKTRRSDKQQVGPCLVPGYEKADSTADTDIEVLVARDSGKPKKEWPKEAVTALNNLKSRHRYQPVAKEKPAAPAPSVVDGTPPVVIPVDRPPSPQIVNPGSIAADVNSRKTLPRIRQRDRKRVGPSLVPGFEGIDSTAQSDIDILKGQALNKPQKEWPQSSSKALNRLLTRRTSAKPENRARKNNYNKQRRNPDGMPTLPVPAPPANLETHGGSQIGEPSSRPLVLNLSRNQMGSMPENEAERHSESGSEDVSSTDSETIFPKAGYIEAKIIRAVEAKKAKGQTATYYRTARDLGLSKAEADRVHQKITRQLNPEVRAENVRKQRANYQARKSNPAYMSRLRRNNEKSSQKLYEQAKLALAWLQGEDSPATVKGYYQQIKSGTADWNTRVANRQIRKLFEGMPPSIYYQIPRKHRPKKSTDRISAIISSSIDPLAIRSFNQSPNPVYQIIGQFCERAAQPRSYPEGGFERIPRFDDALLRQAQLAILNHAPTVARDLDADGIQDRQSLAASFTSSLEAYLAQYGRRSPLPAPHSPGSPESLSDRSMNSGSPVLGSTRGDNRGHSPMALSLVGSQEGGRLNRSTTTSPFSNHSGSSTGSRFAMDIDHDGALSDRSSIPSPVPSLDSDWLEGDLTNWLSPPAIHSPAPQDGAIGAFNRPASASQNQDSQFGTSVPSSVRLSPRISSESPRPTSIRPGPTQIVQPVPQRRWVAKIKERDPAYPDGSRWRARYEYDDGSVSPTYRPSSGLRLTRGKLLSGEISYRNAANETFRDPQGSIPMRVSSPDFGIRNLGNGIYQAITQDSFWGRRQDASNSPFKITPIGRGIYQDRPGRKYYISPETNWLSPYRSSSPVNTPTFRDERPRARVPAPEDTVPAGPSSSRGTTGNVPQPVPQRQLISTLKIPNPASSLGNQRWIAKNEYRRPNAPRERSPFWRDSSPPVLMERFTSNGERYYHPQDYLMSFRQDPGSGGFIPTRLDTPELHLTNIGNGFYTRGNKLWTRLSDDYGTGVEIIRHDEAGEGIYADKFLKQYRINPQTNVLSPYRIPSPDIGLIDNMDGGTVYGNTYTNLNVGPDYGSIWRRSDSPHGTPYRLESDQPRETADLSYLDPTGRGKGAR